MRRWFSPRDNFLSPAFWWGRVDTRPLSIFRIGLALLALKDALYHLPLAHTFYSELGVTPRAAVWAIARTNRFSLMDALPYAWMAALFFLLWALVELLLAAGYRTRLMAVLSWVLIVSVQERTLPVITGADNVLRILSFWMMFLPLGDYYSIDALRARWQRARLSRRLADLRAPSAPRTAWAFPLRLAQVQFAAIYAFTGIAKLTGGIWLRGEALHYALQLQTLTLPTGDWFFQHAPAWLLRLMSWQALATELALPLLLFLPFFQPGLRLAGILLGLMLHGGIMLTMSIPDFSLVMMLGYLLFCEPEWITWLGGWLRPSAGQALIPTLPPNHPLHVLLAITTRSEVAVDARAVLPDAKAEGWWITNPAGRRVSGVAAWRRAAGYLPLSRAWVRLFSLRTGRRLTWQLLEWLVARAALPRWGADRNIAETAPQLTRAEVFGRAALAAAASIVMFAVLWWNMASTKLGNRYLSPGLAGPLRTLVQYLSLWQTWDMFAPFPRTYDSWVLATGRFEDGTQADLLPAGLPSDVMPRWFWGPQARWKKYEDNLHRYAEQPLLRAWADYYCREYNGPDRRPDGPRLVSLEISARWRDSYPPGGAEQAWQDALLWQQECFPADSAGGT